MKKKINAHFLLIAAIAIVATAVCSNILAYRILERQIFEDLKANVHAMSMLDLWELPIQKKYEEDENYSDVIYDLAEDGLRITWIGEDGEIRYDSLEDEGDMENHSSRPEVVEAFTEGEGMAVRKSETSNYQTFYYARRMADGSVLRIGKESASMHHLVYSMIWISAIIGSVVFAMCAVFSRSITKRIVTPVEKLAENLTMVDEETVYEEIRPFVATIKQQHIDILENARMRQEFTANVSHELKTPLTAIYGYAEMITNGMADETDVKQFASYICENAKQLQSLIDDTIKLSQLDDESQKLEFETINLYEVAENAVEMVSISAAEMDVSMQLVGQKVYIAGNRTLIEELLYNLCSNAIRYNKRGGTVIVTVAYEAERPALIVADTGIGIPEDQQERVFERFYRVDQSHSRQTGGTGLGLAIVKQIVAQHEARITLESQVDVGTLVKVVF